MNSKRMCHCRVADNICKLNQNNEFGYEDRDGYFRCNSSLCREVEEAHFHMCYVDFADDIKSGWWGEWEKAIVMQEFMEISKYLTDMEWIRCYDLFLKEACSRKYVTEEMNKLARRLKNKVALRTIRQKRGIELKIHEVQGHH